MSLFRKETRTRFIRDSTGKVVKVEHTGDTEKETMFDRAAKERQAKREAKQRERQEQRYEKKYQRQQEREAYRKAYQQERIRYKTEQGRRVARQGYTGLMPPRKIVYVPAGKKTKKDKQQHPYKKTYHPSSKKKKMVPPDQWANNIMKKWGW